MGGRRWAGGGLKPRWDWWELRAKTQFIILSAMVLQGCTVHLFTNWADPTLTLQDRSRLTGTTTHNDGDDDGETGLEM